MTDANDEKDPGLAVAGDVEPEEQQRLEQDAIENDPYQEKADERLEYEHPEGARDYRVEGNDPRDYIGVDPEYQTYANEYDKPILTDNERWDYTSQYDHLEGNAEEADAESTDETESDQAGHTEQTDEQRRLAAEEESANSVTDQEKVSNPETRGSTSFPPFQA